MNSINGVFVQRLRESTGTTPRENVRLMTASRERTPEGRSEVSRRVCESGPEQERRMIPRKMVRRMACGGFMTGAFRIGVR
jgi:hypothetical protein